MVTPASTRSADSGSDEMEGAPVSYEFDAVVVVNYLYRPLLRDLVASVAPDGLLLYETFAAGNEPRRPAQGRGPSRPASRAPTARHGPASR